LRNFRLNFKRLHDVLVLHARMPLLSRLALFLLLAAGVARCTDIDFSDQLCCILSAASGYSPDRL
jgi:hypothetical protein